MNNEQRLDAAKRCLWHALRRICPAYVVDDDNAATLRSIAQWMVADASNGIDPNRGLLLRGPVGTGKSDMMRGLSAAMTTAGGTGFPVVSVKRIVYEYSRSDERVEQGPSVVMRYAAIDHLCLDDLGTEEDGKHYGKTVSVIADLIAFRYDRWRTGHGITHITTNLDNAALCAKYDERTVSRLSEIVNVLAVPGADRRHAEGNTPRPVPRERLFDDVATDILPTEQAMERLAEIRATVDRAMKDRAEADQHERDNRPSRKETDLLAFKSGLLVLGGGDLRALLAENPAPQYAEAINAALRELETPEP